MLARFTLDCFTAIAFGKSVESIEMYPETHPFAEAFDNLISAIAYRHITPPVNDFTFSVSNIHNLFAVMYDITNYIINSGYGNL